MSRRRPLALVTAVTLVAGGIAVAGAADAAPRTVGDTPTRVLTPTPTADSWGMTQDSAGFVYVSGQGADGDVRVFAPGASGDATPVRRIMGPSTGIVDPYRLAVDADGLMYVANGSGHVTVHAADADGDAAPLRVIDGGAGADALGKVATVDIGPDGRLYVGEFYSQKIKVFERDADAGDEPVRVIEVSGDVLADVQDIEFSPDGSELYAVDYSYLDRVAVFPTQAVGPTAPLRLIEGPATGLAYTGGIDVDSTGNLYVTDYDTWRVSVFGPKADGDVAPHTVLGGPATALRGPWSVVVQPDRSLLVASWDTYQFHTFAPLGAYTRPGSAGTPKVSAPAKNGSRTISWKDVATPDTAAVTYTVVVKQQGSGSALRRTVTVQAKRTSITVPRKQLGAGSHQVTVTPRNELGAGPATSSTFDVRAAKPGKVRRLKVKGKVTAAKRVVRWAPPAWDGGATVKRYRVVVKQGKTTYLKKTVKAPKRKLRVSALSLPFGKSQVTVQAKNAAGLGPKAKKRLVIAP